jgi:hypothetical protein
MAGIVTMRCSSPVEIQSGSAQGGSDLERLEDIIVGSPFFMSEYELISRSGHV